MTAVGFPVLNALARGPMTIDEIVLETGLTPQTVRKYVLNHLRSEPPKIHINGAELSGKSLRVIAIFALGPQKEAA